MSQKGGGMGDHDSTAADRAAVSRLLTSVLAPGDTVMWGQGAGEPLTLTESFVALEQRPAGLEITLGMAMSDTVTADFAASSRVTVIGGFGTNRRLTRAGAADVLPLHMSSVPRLIREGALRVDVALIHVSPADAAGMHVLGAGADQILAAVKAARVVVAEVNARMPRTGGDTAVHASEIHHSIHTDRDLLEVDSGPDPDDITLEIAERVAKLIPDRSTIQLGVGGVPSAVALALDRKRDLGIHTAILTDDMVALMEKGVATGRAKPLDTGVAVGSLLMGSRRLYSFADGNPRLELRSSDHVYSAAVIAQLPGFHSVNSALQIDLSGQLNSEIAGTAYIGALGGQADFMRGAALSPGGRAIIAIPSTRGAASTIVGSLDCGVVTTSRSDVDTVVTEWGVAELKALPLRMRAEALIAVAHPDHRDQLAGWLQKG